MIGWECLFGEIWRDVRNRKQLEQSETFAGVSVAMTIKDGPIAHKPDQLRLAKNHQYPSNLAKHPTKPNHETFPCSFPLECLYS